MRDGIRVVRFVYVFVSWDHYFSREYIDYSKIVRLGDV